MNTYQSITLDAPIDQVWAKIRNFHDLSWAPNVIQQCESMGTIPGDKVGARRKLNEMFEETLLNLDDGNHQIDYSIDDGPHPVARGDVHDYQGHIQLRPVTETNQTFVEWSSEWQSTSDEAAAFCHGIYVALLQDMKTSIRH